MAFEKKPSSSTDRGKVRSAEELETYGVWVKSGPQDMSADFGDDAVPFDHPGFDMGFGGMGAPGAGRESPDIAFDSFDDGSFVADGFVDGNFAQGPFENDNFTQGSFPPGGMGPSPQDEVSAQLLLRIADELSSIRADIDNLKKDLAGIRSEGGSDGTGPVVEADAWGTGFFTGEDDGKITLTDNEMDNILASSGFKDARGGFTLDEDEGNDFASLRDADAAALKELSRQNEAADLGSLIDDDETEGSGIDFGMDLGDSSPFGDVDEGDVADMQDRLTELETDNVFDTDLDFLNEGVPRADNLEIEENDIFEAFSDDLPSPDALDDMDELRDLRMHGVNPLTPPPEDSSYLEEDPFISSGMGDERVFDGEDAENAFDAGVGEGGFDFDAFGAAVQPEDGVMVVSEVSYEVSYTEELSPVGVLPSLDDEGESFDNELSLGDYSSLDDMPSANNVEDDELAIGDEVFLDDPLSQGGELLLDDSLSEDDDLSLTDGLFMDDDGLSMGEDISLGEDELTLDGEMSLDDEPSLDDEIALPSWLLSSETPGADESPSMEEDDLSLDGEFAMDGEMSLEDDPLPGGDISLDDDTEEADDDGLPEFPREFPDPSSDDLMLDEATLDESALDEPILDDDISLDLDGFDDGFEIDDLGSEDSNIIRVIPEGFKTGAEETLISFDDDLEAITEEEEAPSPPPKEKPEGKPKSRNKPKTRAEKMAAVDENPDISPNLRKDLKNVLSYMDQLLESLPEDKIEEFAKSDHFDTYRKLFKELGLVQ